MKKYFIKYINGSVELKDEKNGVEENIKLGLIETFVDIKNEIVKVLVKNQQGQLVMKEFNLKDETKNT